MRCEQCKRKVRNSFGDKILHIMRYHPDKLMDRIGHWPLVSRSIGEQLGEQVKGMLSNGNKKTKA